MIEACLRIVTVYRGNQNKYAYGLRDYNFAPKLCLNIYIAMLTFVCALYTCIECEEGLVKRAMFTKSCQITWTLQNYNIIFSPYTVQLQQYCGTWYDIPFTFKNDVRTYDAKNEIRSYSDNCSSVH